MKFFVLPILLLAAVSMMSCEEHKDPLRPVEATPPPPLPQQGVPPAQDINGAVSPGGQDPVRP